jgi:transcriptional regulator with XRE-family HTH domain
MSMKLSDTDVATMRNLAAKGTSRGDLAAQFGVTRRHVGRILRGEQRQQLGGLDQDLARGSLVQATERFLSGLGDRLCADEVLAEAALALAAKLDQARASDASAGPGDRSRVGCDSRCSPVCSASLPSHEP